MTPHKSNGKEDYSEEDGCIAAGFIFFLVAVILMFICWRFR